LDNYFKLENTKYFNYNSLFCCFGSQTKHGEETFIKVDKTYPLLAADIAIKNSIYDNIEIFLIFYLYHQWEVIQKAGFYILEQKAKYKRN